MNIKAKINARKVAFTYFFQKYYCEYSAKSDLFFEDIVKTEKIVNWNNVSEEENEQIRINLEKSYDIKDWQEDIDYLISNFFKMEQEEGIDFEYISSVVPYYDEYKGFVENKVDEYKDTFEYSQMDLVDRVIFLLGYIEFIKEVNPKNIVLNEMIELAKRYWDDNSYRLINWIGHKLLG